MNVVERDGALTFDVRIVPRASKSEIAGRHDGALKVRICAPPVDGAANAELTKLLAKRFGVAKRDVAILSGANSKSKRIRITGITRAEFETIIR
jgi:uncharacterized protein